MQLPRFFGIETPDLKQVAKLRFKGEFNGQAQLFVGVVGQLKLVRHRKGAAVNRPFISGPHLKFVQLRSVR